ncbi:MAG TPA: ergothioneine biosynthesis protein EgtB, partial [Marinobacter adhaerens]|nr:ergothioneine biosynthesis protein EgtB [Marinobacter adhaerens]
EKQPLTDQARYLYRYAIYHQNMHIESMIWCRQTVGYPAPPGTDFYRPAPGDSHQGDAYVPAGEWLIGMPSESGQYASDDFAFDNEKPWFTVTLESFAISKCLVSNREFMQFVEDGGYRRPELWSFGGRKWLQTETDVALVHGSDEPFIRTPRHPLYWRWHDEQWQERVFDRWQPLNPDAPVT